MKHIQQLAIKSAEFATRRSLLSENILKQYHNKNHFIILPTSDVQYKTNHIPRPYHHDTSFYYYTGYMEKKAVLLLNANTTGVKTTLFIDNPTEEDILWNGPYPSKEIAKDISGIDDIIYYNDFAKYITKSIKNKENSILWTVSSINAHSFNENISNLSKLMKRNPLDLFVDRQRLIKSKSEIEIMRQAAVIAGDALHSAFRFTKPHMNEQQVLAKLFYEINIRGAKLAYPPVIAGGKRANIIHYLNSDKYIGDNELVLVDVGADVLGYYSDLTRTWPVNGRFSPEQAVLYDILHAIRSDCVSNCHPDKSLHELYQIMLDRLGFYLREGGIMKTNADVRQLCPHHIGHYLGLDIHDTPSVSTLAPLAPGTVFPLEPGIYVSDHNALVDPRYRGIGMRLEDDFVMTESGIVDCLSEGLARSRADIEAICNMNSSADCESQSLSSNKCI